jgi:hypothetical protein
MGRQQAHIIKKKVRQQTERQTDRQSVRQTDRQANRQTDRQTAGKQTEGNTDRIFNHPYLVPMCAI